MVKMNWGATARDRTGLLARGCPARGGYDRVVSETFGANAWLVDEMYEQYVDDPSSVSESWQEFFADYRKAGSRDDGGARPGGDGARPVAPLSPAATARPQASPPGTVAVKATAARAPPAPAPRPRLRSRRPPASPAAPPAAGAGAASRRPPRRHRPATRSPPSGARRPASSATWRRARHPDGHQLPGGAGQAAGGQPPGDQRLPRAGPAGARSASPTSSATPWSRASRPLPVMNSSYAPTADGKPGVVHHSRVGLGLAVDVEKSDGSRTLLVPCIKDAHALDFQQFLDRLRGPHPQGQEQQDRPRRLRRHHGHPDQPRHHRDGPVGAPAHAGPGRHRRRRHHRLPGRVAGRRSRPRWPTSGSARW